MSPDPYPLRIRLAAAWQTKQWRPWVWRRRYTLTLKTMRKFERDLAAWAEANVAGTIVSDTTLSTVKAHLEAELRLRGYDPDRVARIIHTVRYEGDGRFIVWDWAL